MLSIERLLIDGTLMCLIMGIIIIGSLYYNPRLWLQDYPAEIRAKVPPLTPREKRERLMVALPILLMFIGIPLYSTIQLKLMQGSALGFWTAYLNTALILNLVNLFDALIIDWLFLTVMKPQFVILPGTEGMEHLLYDLKMQFRNFLKGIVISSLLSLPITLVALVLAG